MAGPDLRFIGERLDKIPKVRALDSKVDAVDRSLGARMDQFAARVATNLQIVLAALQGKPVHRRLRSC